jgi:hypothetical protein
VFKFLKYGSIILGALLLLYPLGRSAAGDDVGVGVVKDLLAQLWDYQNGKAGGQKHVGFDLPETLVNQYIAYLIDSQTRRGVKQATIKVASKNQVSVACRLDLRQIKAWDPSVIGEGSPLVGKDELAVNATVSVDITNGMAKISILSASDASGAVDKAVIQQLFQVVASNQPEHFDLNKPIKLPFNLSVAMVDGVFYGKTSGRGR